MTAGLHFGITDDTDANSFLVPQQTDKFVGHEWYMGRKRLHLGNGVTNEIQGYRFFYVFHNKLVRIGKYFERHFLKKRRGTIKVFIVHLV
jgi:hypothetical protein